MNPIVEWAKENYWQKRIIIKEAEVTKPQTPTKVKPSNVIMGGKEMYIDPAK